MTEKNVFLKNLRSSMNRREFLSKSALGVAGVALGGSIPGISNAANETVTLGMNIPMTGDYAPWGLPGLYGCDIIAKNVNDAGGVAIGNKT